MARDGGGMPDPGTNLLVMRIYPGGVAALWDEANQRVIFVKFEAAFEAYEPDVDWRQVGPPPPPHSQAPLLEPDPGA